MTTRAFKLGAICLLGLAASVYAKDIAKATQVLPGQNMPKYLPVSMISDGQTEQNGLKFSSGVINFKQLDKKEGFLNIKYAKNLFADMTSIFDMTYSSAYKDLSIANRAVGSDDNFAYYCGTGLGYLQHDSKKIQIINQAIVKQSTTQKSPYFMLEGAIGKDIGNEMIFEAKANVKLSLDRADLQNSYGVEFLVGYKNWSIGYGYEKYDFNGAPSNEDTKISLSYTILF